MRMQSFVSGVLAASLAVSPFTVRAEMIGTAALLSAAEAAGQEERVAAFLGREDVQGQLVALGVEPAQAAARVAALTDAELQELSGRIESLPAGAGALEIALLVVLILLILELAGAINIFTKV
jgi:hypothetical protein